MNQKTVRIVPGDSLQGAFDAVQQHARRSFPIRSRNAMVSTTTRGTTVRPLATSEDSTATNQTNIPRYG